jgi:anthranilate synthase component 1
MIADLETPVSAFMKINRGGNSFLLESVEGGERIARYSFIGTEPYKTIKTNNGDKTDPLPLIEQEMKKYKIVPVSGLPRFSGGAVGYLAYEAVTCFEELPSPDADPLGLPESLFMFVDTMLVFDHVRHLIKILSHARLDGDDGDIEEEYKKAVGRIEVLADRLDQPLKQSRSSKNDSEIMNNLELTSNFSREGFEQSVRKIKEYITAGEAIQVVLSQRLSQKTDVPPFEIYRALRSINPSPYMFFLDFMPGPDLGEKQRTKIAGLNRSFKEMKRNAPSILCLLTWGATTSGMSASRVR